MKIILLYIANIPSSFCLAFMMLFTAMQMVADRIACFFMKWGFRLSTLTDMRHK